ncbi:serine hydrolase [Sphingomicrobium sp. XHP0239]|uniref:serine hydrolase domain-containing protein n=1 Tax=Sphingomicrobium maritimum TaxID=3133972 RepID=UPI0031CC4B1E
MKKFLLVPMALALTACPPPEGHVYSASSPEASERARADLQPVLDRHGFDGDLRVSGGRLDGARVGRMRVWPWASVTKQIVAVMVMQEVEAGRLDLDTPVSDYVDWPESSEDFVPPTLRQLLKHQSGLLDQEPRFGQPDAVPPEDYECSRQIDAAGGAFVYNNCDTIIAASVLEALTRHSIGELFHERIAAPLGLASSGFATAETPLADSRDGSLTPHDVSLYGAAGGLAGTPEGLVVVSRALLDGRLLGEAARAEMWRGDPELGYTALGQWDVTLPLDGCDAPVRIIERRGAVPGYQARNFILPDLGIVVVAFIGRSEENYSFGEPWSGEGLSYDLLSAAACGD